MDSLTTGIPSQLFSDAQQPEPIGLSTAEVDTLATKLDLSNDDQTTLHKFNQSSPCVQNIMYFSTVLAQARRIEGIEAMCARLYVHYKHLGTLIKENWTPSDAEKMLFERLLRYYLMHDLNTYITLPNHVMIFIYTHGFRLHMDNFSEDAILRTTMENYLRMEATNVKRSFQQMICAHTKPGSLPLLQLTRHFLQEHWIGAAEDPPNEFHLCAIANFREIACRIQGKATMTIKSSENSSLVTTLPKGNEDVLTDQQVAATSESMINKSRCIDTGFWRTVEDELEERIAKFGYSRDAPEWVKWRHMIIKRDQDRFGTPTSLVFNNAELLAQNDEQDRVHSRESDFAFVQALNLA